jgi:hypothetical protein
MKSGKPAKTRDRAPPTKKVTPEGNEPPGSFRLLAMKTDRQLLKELAAQLEAWAIESRKGGWSTHQVGPMENKAAEIWAHLGKTQP